ncbi:putative ankyrin repeat protein RF_0381 isoform X1 [Dreissena polymorpha]|uniref:SOCS box domain-containing protein n=1 Tax=Dreissena polymorpha TaxID=45954 RepID=A0A9D4H544_DREPO|nr:putative ankyrin repeat protein RF_0381 isoform X1 [Dreissena polymorpha]KAH3827156.1 hypothetical protein DPMN_129085 [Dreissena polymorpha]
MIRCEGQVHDRVRFVHHMEEEEDLGPRLMVYVDCQYYRYATTKPKFDCNNNNNNNSIFFIDTDSRMLKFQDNVTKTRFFTCIENGDFNSVDKLLKNEDFKNYLEENDQLSLAFLKVILLNNIPLLDVLIKHGVDVNLSDFSFSENGIMHATRYGHKEILLKLIDYGVNINHQSANGSTALHVAVENMKRECLIILARQNGIDLNIQDCGGFSPLLWTARLRDWQAMQILIDVGCHIESKDFVKGMTALHVVCDSSTAFWKGERATPSDTLKCIKLLTCAGLDINSGDVFNNTPLMYAIRTHNQVAIKHLLKMNCSFRATQRVGSSSALTPFYFNHNLVGSDSTLLPLYLALAKLQTNTVKMLCLAGIRYHRLAQEPEVTHFISTAYEPLGKVMHDLVCNPMSLKQACRYTIRSALTVGMDKFERLNIGLPVSLINYLCLNDIDDM